MSEPGKGLVTFGEVVVKDGARGCGAVVDGVAYEKPAVASRYRIACRAAVPAIG